jgi:2-polyprenyl-3-methyl-5-hydroxy-6-metoxy-1,4-benzoquinol methylase
MHADFESVACVLCGSPAAIALADTGQFGLPCHVAICPHDGLVYLNPRWTRSRLQHFYRVEYDRYYRPDVLGAQSDDAKFGSIRAVAERLVPSGILARARAVVDVGAGMGWSLEWLSREYPGITERCAIESSAHCVQHIRDNLGAHVIGADLDEPWTRTGFDLIIMRHVLEHTLDPVSSLRHVAQQLADDGRLYIAVPNMMHPYPENPRRSWFRTVHTFYFSSATLAACAAPAGLVCDEIHPAGHEIWGIFRRDDVAAKRVRVPNVFQDQLHIITSLLAKP